MSLVVVAAGGLGHPQGNPLPSPVQRPRAGSCVVVLSMFQRQAQALLTMAAATLTRTHRPEAAEPRAEPPSSPSDPSWLQAMAVTNDRSVKH